VRYGSLASVRIEADEHFATVIVQDQGPGVPAADLAKLGAPFFRLETSRSRETGGSGLGLAIAKAAAERSGGALQLENTTTGLQVRLRLGRI
jgi:signal transduction histidine kinase